MSRLSAQCDRLRELADGQATFRDAREAMLKAADTITELHGALLVASVDYRHLSDENAKLRELLCTLAYCANDMAVCDDCPVNGSHYMTVSMTVRQSFCDGMADRLRELGVEVDG